MKHQYLQRLVLALLLWGWAKAQAAPLGDLTLKQAINTAQQLDPWQTRSQQLQQAIELKSQAAAVLPNPMVQVGVANIPLDNPNLHAEPMTQLGISISQQWPRGNSRFLTQQQLHQSAAKQPFLQQDRRAQVAVTVSHAWLEVFRAEHTIALIEHDRALFEHLVAVTEAGYANALNKTRQQDFIRAQLELTRLEDRLVKLAQQKEVAQAGLAQWLNTAAVGSFSLAASKPQVRLLQPQFVGPLNASQRTQLIAQLQQHPAMLALNQDIAAANTNTRLAQQNYRPQWGLSAGYGYRERDLAGNPRSDFGSIAIKLDIPIFAHAKNDQLMGAANAEHQALKTEQQLLLRRLLSECEQALASLARQAQRQQLFDERLLMQMHEQAEAALTAYTNDAGDFAEVVRARIAELNAHIERLDIEVDILRIKSQINYFLTLSEGAKHAS